MGIFVKPQKFSLILKHIVNGIFNKIMQNVVKVLSALKRSKKSKKYLRLETIPFNGNIFENCVPQLLMLNCL